MTDIAAPTVLSRARQVRVLAYCALLLLLLNHAAPYAGLVGIPVTFFLKNRLHLGANQMAQFNLWVGLPLYVGFLFGFVRDRWSPFGLADRGYLVLFGAATALAYVVIAFVPPGYGLLLAGILVVTVAIQFVASAVNGLVSEAGQKHLMAGQSSMVFNVASFLPAIAAFFGGLLSDRLEGEAAVMAARILFLLAAAFMLAIVVLGLKGPAWLYAETRAQHENQASVFTDLARLVRHWPIYPPLMMLVLWDFGPAIGTALVYHLSADLHASDTAVGAWYALFFGAGVPTLLLYGWLCRRFRLRTLLIVGTALAVLQMLPLLFVHTVNGVLAMAVVMGLLGGIASGAYVDLAIRSCPERLQGTMMMLVVTVYWIAVRFGDLWGTDLYEHQGGFTTAIWASTAVYAAIFPVLLLAPKHLTATMDGEAPQT
jgi:predicted MFS family arabinose efflux permease